MNRRRQSFALALLFALAVTGCSNPTGWIKSLWPVLAPRASDSTTVPTESIAAPVISPSSGAYDSGQSVTITCATPSASIHYSTDGSAPTASSTLYSVGGINVTPGQTVTVKAIATLSGMSDSSVSQAAIHVRSWVIVGNANFTGGDIVTPSLAIAPDGTPFVGFVDAGGYGNEPSVMYLSGSAWFPLGGSRGFAPLSIWGPSMAIDASSRYYLGARDSTSTKLTVFRYDGAWNILGFSGFANQVADGTTTSLALDPVDDTPYIAYVSGSSSGGPAAVMKFNSTSWVTVGSGAGFSPGNADSLSLAIDYNHKPYIGFMDYSTTPAPDAATVMSFDGSSWNLVGPRGFTNDWVNYTALVVDSAGIPYLGFQNNSYQAAVWKFDGANWTDLGNAAAISGNIVGRTSLAISRAAISKDKIYLGYYRSFSATDYRMSVIKFNGTSWDILGSADFYSNPNAPDFIQLAISPNNGTPYISIQQSNSTTTVMAFQ
jgi:hypothetical protein